MLNYQLLLNEIKKYSKITIFRHTNPDGDAVGSQLALKEWISTNFKDKQVKALGHDIFDIYPFVDKINDDFIIDSLAIVLDTANSERVDDKRFLMAKKIIRIDHHPLTEEFGDLLIIEDKRSSVCELLTAIFVDPIYEDYSINDKCATYLYSGLLTDTLCFKTANTTSQTLMMAAELAKHNIAIDEIANTMFGKGIEEFVNRTKIRNLFKYNNGLCVVKIDRQQLASMHINSSQARTMIDEFGLVKEFKIWTILVYNEDNGLYDGSLRSKKQYIINKIANKYNGGGHANACGIKKLSEYDCQSLERDLLNCIDEIDNR